MLLQGINIVITGAGRGLGRIIAERLSNDGACVALIARSENELQETIQVIHKHNKNSFYFCADIADETSILSGVEFIKSRFHKIDVLINNAGIQAPIGPFSSNSLADWKRNFEVNFFGTVNVIYSILPFMIKEHKGKIINLSGGGATSSRANFSAYACSKTSVVRLTEILAEELSEYNIDVNAVAPGAINTKMLDEVLEAKNLAGKEYNDAKKRKERGGADPALAAELISFLSSAESDGITGKLISAPWDNWQSGELRNLLKDDKDLFTLRRIDNKSFCRKENGKI